MRRAWIALVLMLMPGCVIASSTESSGGGFSCAEDRPLAPGETVEGVDPELVLAPYFDTSQGQLTWLTGGATELTLTVERAPEQPLSLIDCARRFRTGAIATLRTQDGSLNDSVPATVAAPVSKPAAPGRYDYVEDLDYNVTPSALPLSQAQGSLASKIPQLDRYESSSVVLQLKHGGEGLPVAFGALVFSGARPGASDPDQIEIGTWYPL